MVILVTGSKGLLGNDFCQILSKNHRVIALGRDELDITRPETVDKVKNYSPDLVCHLAAYTDVDGCEKNPEKAFEVNGQGTRNVALGARKARVPILYLSTDYLFDGEKKEPYKENDSPNPLNVYGRSKLEGENRIMEILQDYYIVRSSWLFGVSGKNFVDTILKLAEEREVLQVVADQIGSPTYTPDLAEALQKLIDLGSFGVYHVTNSGSCSWFEFARKACELAEVTNCRLEETDTERFPRPATRPSYSVLDNSHFQGVLGCSIRSWEEALGDYMVMRKSVQDG
ncbi:dTDP-4-dehydrorhamnose reductase [candidate division TA06 bacterium]|nr:dTDP-4-dehydrorhamnose reductase [candidate division TA06 bacterium]